MNANDVPLDMRGEEPEVKLLDDVIDAQERLGAVICAIQECIREPLLTDLRWVADTLDGVEDWIRSMQKQSNPNQESGR